MQRAAAASSIMARTSATATRPKPAGSPEPSTGYCSTRATIATIP